MYKSKGCSVSQCLTSHAALFQNSTSGDLYQLSRPEKMDMLQTHILHIISQIITIQL